MIRAIFLLILVCCSAAWAQTPSPAASPVDKPDPEVVQQPENPAHNELRELRTRMQAAMNARDVEALLTGVTDDVVFTTMNGDVVRGKDGIRDYFTKMMTGPDAIVDSVNTNFEADELTQLFGGSLGEPETAGVAFGHSKDSYVLKDGTKFDVAPRWTATMIREPDGWKVASFHYSVSMFSNPVLDKMTKSVSMLAGGALAVGAVLGLVIGFVLGRRKKS